MSVAVVWTCDVCGRTVTSAAVAERILPGWSWMIDTNRDVCPLHPEVGHDAVTLAVREGMDPGVAR